MLGGDDDPVIIVRMERMRRTSPGGVTRTPRVRRSGTCARNFLTPLGARLGESEGPRDRGALSVVVLWFFCQGEEAQARFELADVSLWFEAGSQRDPILLSRLSG